MDIKVEEIKNAFLSIDNSIVEGEIEEIKNRDRILFKLKPDAIIPSSSTGKRGEVFFEYRSNKYFGAGKVFFQSHSKVLILLETDIGINKRHEIRKEIPGLPAIVYTHGGIFKHSIKCVILDISLSGARIETTEELEKNRMYNIECTFLYRQTKLEFKASFFIKNSTSSHNIFRYGIYFSGMDPISQKNLNKYLLR
ncbi:MAG: PilZ domain-containing protein [Candidatus Omnitrophica bacterium]|nr:PilZ domain-containing protein [Candidatus Omnitrophota bacterium]